MQDPLNILVVDDEQSIRITLAGILEDEGYNVVIAEDGYKGIAAAEKINFNIAFIDMKMPGISGIETLKKFKKISPNTIILLMTAFLDEDALNDATKLKVQRILYKPLDLDLILKILRENQAKASILVVNDNSSICNTLQGILVHRGYKVFVAENGYTAIQMARNTHFDIVFIDVVMPGIDGFQTLEEIKKIDPITNVIMVTNQNIEDFTDKAFAHITKPVDLTKLLQLISNAIEKNRR
ncbi:MAG: response regulator [Candidatus Scalindua sp.]|jgi:DNA-binding NtrC family response regulator|nr:response regulator [Candidatus Scalindua sp.]